MRIQTVSSVVAVLLLLACGKPGEVPQGEAQTLSWQTVETGSTASLRGLSAVDRSTAWVTGTEGTILRTTDGGESWQQIVIPGTEELDFRDVEAFDGQTAVVMTAGQPARFYRTVEKDGATFELVHESPYEAAFFDSIAFWDQNRGLAFSDPVDGRFLILKTEDGGRSWQEVAETALPAPVEGEAGFAASGSNVAVGPGGRAWMGTGGAAARVLRSTDFGETWKAVETPLLDGEPSAGVFSVAFRDELRGIAAGGDYQAPESTGGTLAWTEDGGKSWTAATTPPPSGHRAAVVFAKPDLWISAGRAGCDLSRDGGRTWEKLSEEGYYTLDVGRDGTVWAAGSDGRVARLRP